MENALTPAGVTDCRGWAEVARTSQWEEPNQIFPATLPPVPATLITSLAAHYEVVW